MRAYFPEAGRQLDPFSEPVSLAVGMFDGVHRGHQRVIAGAREAARRSGRHAGVLTFDPHPSRVLHPERATRLLFPLQRRLEHLLAQDLDFVLVQHFTKAYGSRTAESFPEHLKNCLPGLGSLHVGENFRYGAKRLGDVALLKETAGELGVEVVAWSRANVAGEAISSSRIRKLVTAGEVGEAGRLMGRPYVARGPLTSGRQLGRTLGFPTLNIPFEPETQPPYGVYGAGLIRDARILGMGLANYGLRPTVEDAAEPQPLLELHLLEGPEDGFPAEGEELRVALTEFIRPEKAFGGLEALREQIGQDVAQAKTRLSGWREQLTP